MTPFAEVFASLSIALVLGAIAPWAFMRMLEPALCESERARVLNFRGHTVHSGLGIVWLVWAGCAILAGVVYASWFPSIAAAPVLTLAGPLALVAFAVGLVDDAFGSGSARGFKGHLAAFAEGKLTTGGFKLVGIGAASAVVALVIARVAPWGAGTGVGPVLWMLVAAAAIALTSNLVNLTDLRPGRALKTYSLLSLLGVASVVVGLGSSATFWSTVARRPLLETAVMAIMLLGPVLAVWRDDLGERGMLGDAGANAMGAVAGLMIVGGLSSWMLALYAAAVLALNVLSERISFSAVIERTTALRWLDGLGRAARDGELEIHKESSGSTPTDVGAARYHLEDDHHTEEA